MEVTTTVTFDEVDDGKTVLTVQEVGIPGEMDNLHEWAGSSHLISLRSRLK
jgi:hypothetical protein